MRDGKHFSFAIELLSDEIFLCFPNTTVCPLTFSLAFFPAFVRKPAPGLGCFLPIPWRELSLSLCFFDNKSEVSKAPLSRFNIVLLSLILNVLSSVNYYEASVTRAFIPGPLQPSCKYAPVRTSTASAEDSRRTLLPSLSIILGA